MTRGDENKFDDGKLMWDLLPYDQVEKVVEILTYGANKYSANSWQGVDKERYFAALMRHLVAYRKGEVLDEESGLSHLAHATCNLIFLMWKEENELNI